MTTAAIFQWPISRAMSRVAICVVQTPAECCEEPHVRFCRSTESLVLRTRCIFQAMGDSDIGYLISLKSDPVCEAQRVGVDIPDRRRNCTRRGQWCSFQTTARHSSLSFSLLPRSSMSGFEPRYPFPAIPPAPAVDLFPSVPFPSLPACHRQQHHSSFDALTGLIPISVVRKLPPVTPTSEMDGATPGPHHRHGVPVILHGVVILRTDDAACVLWWALDGREHQTESNSSRPTGGPG